MSIEPSQRGGKAEQLPRSKAKTIVYILGDYPSLSTTFIDREILEAKRRGLNLELLSIGRPRCDALSKPVQDLVAGIDYIFPISLVQLMRTNVIAFARNARTYTSTLAFIVTREHPSFGRRVKSLAHFFLGVQAAVILKEKIQMVGHLHAHFADRAAVVAMVASRLLNVPYSVTAHAYEIYREPIFLRDKIRGAKFATTCTSFNKEKLEKLTDVKVELIHHGLDFSAIRRTEGERGHRAAGPLVLSVGRLEEKKGFEYLIRACAALKQKGYRFSCEIVGDGSSHARLQALIAAEGAADFVTLCGALPNSEVFQKYMEAAMFVLPSCVAKDGDRDGIPNVILEAMACELPVISTCVSGIPEVVRQSDTGLLVPPNDVHELCIAMARLLDSQEDSRRMGKNAAKFVREEFDIRKNVVRLIELLGGD